MFYLYPSLFLCCHSFHYYFFWINCCTRHIFIKYLRNQSWRGFAFLLFNVGQWNLNQLTRKQYGSNSQDRRPWIIVFIFYYFFLFLSVWVLQISCVRKLQSACGMTKAFSLVLIFSPFKVIDQLETVDVRSKTQMK